jgi:hypothetical protein
MPGAYSTAATKECARCGGLFDAEAFFRTHHGGAYAHAPSRGTQSVCIGCEQTARDAEKARDRWPAKVRDTIRLHARKLGVTVVVLVKEFGWEFDQLLHDVKHAYSNGCPYCRESFAGMGHGFGDITLDLVERADPPHYSINTKWVCATCNREKGRTPAELWARKLAAWAEWDRHQKRLQRMGPPQGKLF